MDQKRRFIRNLSNETKGLSANNNNLQKKLAESRKPVVVKKAEQVLPDLTDFMNDMFFGVVNNEKKVYNFSGGDRKMDNDDEEEEDDDDDEEEDDFDCSTRSTTSKLTQEWLQEAKRMVATSPSKGSDSPPSRLVGSPRFGAVAAAPRLSTSSVDRRDPLSRSARRHRSVDGFTGDILTKTARHSRHNSQSLDSPPPASIPTDESPASAVHKWFSNILKPPPPSPSSISPDPSPPSNNLLPLPPRVSTSRRSRFENHPSPPPPHSQSSSAEPTFPPPDPTVLFPPRLSIHRKSRFQNDPNAAQPQLIPTSTKRTFRQPPVPDSQLLSPPKDLNISARRRSISSSTCTLPVNQVLSPPRNLLESAHRRSISSSTCSAEKILKKPSTVINGEMKEVEFGGAHLNGFLKEQRMKIEKLVNGEIQGKAKIVLSGPSNSTSSMVAAICYTWWLENKMRKNKVGDRSEVVVPVLNVKRGKMWKQQQAAWLFHHAGVDASLLLFADEVDLETLMMNKQLTILVVGQDILKTNNEVGSKCTILTDNFCEDAYDLLQIPVLKQLLLAGILLDTQNLNTSAKLAMTKDAEAVQLLLVGSGPNHRNSLYDQLMQDKRDGTFFEALRQNYGKSPTEDNLESRTQPEDKVSGKKSYTGGIKHTSVKDSNQLKNSNSDTVSPKSAKGKPPPKQAPSPAPTPSPTESTDASRGKNKNIFAKWFGFGK